MLYSNSVIWCASVIFSYSYYICQSSVHFPTDLFYNVTAGVPVVSGTMEAIRTKEAAVEVIQSIGLPVILKAAYGGGGRGMRIVRNKLVSYQDPLGGSLAQSVQRRTLDLMV